MSLSPLIKSNDIRYDGAALRQQAHCQGYLFFPALIGPASILKIRSDIVSILQQVGWIDADTDPLQACTSHKACVSGSPEFSRVYDRIQRLESFHSLAHHPSLFHIVESLLQADVLLQPSNISRVIFPSQLEQTTPPHQDYVHIQGTPNVWTVWIPLGDCPQQLGGLSVLVGSHHLGILPVSKSLGAGGLRADTQSADLEWAASPFNCGDVLFFHSHTVHQGLDNLSGNQLRLSVDYRYQKANDPVMDRLLGPHQGRLTWEEVYADWESDKYQYYWQKFPLQLVPKQVWPIETKLAEGN
tara:strand:+ start:1873 stop:2769 length:897 start_codon:yes stop_codon:yes gene_type:complete